MPTTALGTPYVSSSDYVSNYPTVSQNLANAIDAFGGVRVYTTAAARDAAITAPFEGMVAYLTAPAAATVTATGTTTAIPTGITTVYNGSAWVCTTPVGAYSNTSATTTSTSYVTTLTGDTTAISVTLATGTTALISISCNMAVSVANTLYTTFSVSGATTLSASDTNGAYQYAASAGFNFGATRVYTFSGLTAGTNTFTLAYKTNGGTLTMVQRNLTVQGIA